MEYHWFVDLLYQWLQLQAMREILLLNKVLTKVNLKAFTTNHNLKIQEWF